MDVVYKGITLEDLGRDVRFVRLQNSNVVSDGKYREKNIDYIDKLFAFDKKLLTEEQLKKISALSSVINLNRQINIGGIRQYYINECDKYCESNNAKDIVQLDKIDQENMLDELLFFGLEVFPDCERDNMVFDEVVSQFKKIFVEDEECIATTYGEEYIRFETVIRNSDGFDDKFFSIAAYMETLIEGYAQYLCKSFEREKEIGRKPGLDELISEGSKRIIENEVLENLFKDVEHNF